MKKGLLFLLIFCLILVFIPSSSFAKSDQEHVHLKLNLDLTEDVKYFSENKYVKKGNKERFGVDDWLSVQGFLDINLFYKISNNQANIEGNAVVHLNEDTYPISFKGKLIVNEYEGSKYVFGPIFSTIKNRKGEEKGLFGLYLNLDNNDVYVAYTAGPVDIEEGNGMLFFGTKSELLKHIIDERRSSLSTSKNLMNQNNGNNDVNTVQVAYTQAQGDYYLRGSTYTYRAKYHEYYSDPGTYDYLDYKTLVLNVFDLDPKTNGGNSGSVQIRAWTNSYAIEDYITGDGGGSTPYADVEEVNITFGSNSSWLNIDDDHAAPLDGSDFELSSAWEFVSYIPRIGGFLNFVANAYAALVNSNPPDIYSETSTGANGRVYQLKKHVSNIVSKAPDLPDPNTSYSATETIEEGGITFWFDYTEYTTSTSETVFAKGQAVYFGSGDLGYPMGWYFTPEISYSWTVQLP